MSFPQGGSSQGPQSWWAGTGGGADHPHIRTSSSHLLWPQSNPSSLGLTAASLPGPHTAQLARGESAAATAPARTPVWLWLPSTLPVELSARLSPECPTATVALGGLHDFPQGCSLGPIPSLARENPSPGGCGEVGGCVPLPQGLWWDPGAGEEPEEHCLPSRTGGEVQSCSA